MGCRRNVGVMGWLLTSGNFSSPTLRARGRSEYPTIYTPRLRCGILQCGEGAAEARVRRIEGRTHTQASSVGGLRSAWYCICACVCLCVCLLSLYVCLPGCLWSRVAESLCLCDEVCPIPFSFHSAFVSPVSSHLASSHLVFFWFVFSVACLSPSALLSDSCHPSISRSLYLSSPLTSRHLLYIYLEFCPFFSIISPGCLSICLIV